MAFGSTFFHQRLGASSAVGGAVFGSPPTVLNAIPRWQDTTGTLLDSSNILITGSDDIWMFDTDENTILFRRTGVLGSYLDPQFSIARITSLASGEVTFRFIFSDDSDPERTVGYVSSDGEIASIRETIGGHFAGYIGTQLIPTIEIVTAPYAQIQMGEETIDQEADTAIGRPSSQVINFLTGTNIAGLTERARVTATELCLASGVSLGVTDFASKPVAPSAGKQLIYSKNGALYRLDENDNEVVIENLPVVTFEAGYANRQNTGYLRGTDGEFTNIAPFVVPFDCDIIGITATCRTAVNEWRAQMFINALPLPAINLVVLNTETKKEDEPVAVTADKSDVLSIYLLKGVGGLGTGQNIPSPKVQIFMRKRV